MIISIGKYPYQDYYYCSRQETIDLLQKISELNLYLYKETVIDIINALIESNLIRRIYLDEQDDIALLQTEKHLAL